MSACVKFGLDRLSRLASHTEQTNRQTDKHNAFYYIDWPIIEPLSLSIGLDLEILSLEFESKRDLKSPE